MNQGLCVVVTGSSGTGKTSVVNRLIKEFPASARLITTTSRSPRPNEVDGQDYNFVSRDHFERLVQNGELLEWEEIYGNLYGSERRMLEQMLNNHPVVFTTLDVRGAKTYQKEVPQVITIAMFVPPEQIPGRILNRGAIDSIELEKRIEAVTDEQNEIGVFDFIVENLDGQLDSSTVPHCKKYILEELQKRGIKLPSLD
ncbi:MAG: hypothetical protein V1738_03850 [Patescibacteria group bacterium]